MSVDYDLAIIGATPAAAAAAIAAARTHARSIWLPEATPTPDPLLLLREGSRGLGDRQGSVTPGDWLLWTDTLQSALAAERSPSAVQAYGVDYLEGAVQFQPDDSIVAGQRRVRSRAYLLAMDAEAERPAIEGIDHPQVWTMPVLWDKLRLASRDWPQSIAVLGDGPQAIELSQSLRRLGRSVLLVTGTHPLLPKEDEETAFLLQSYLEGGGIQIANRGALTAIQPSLDALLLEVGDCKYRAEALVIATETFRRLPATLAPLGLRQMQQGIAVNSALQTSNPRIYAIGSLLGGYQLPGIALQEARLAVQNALFERRSPMQYHQLPYAISSDPPLARVGLTEAQARQYDPQVRVLRENYKECDRARFDRSPVGLCKVLVQKDGTVLGAHIVGAAAAELIHLFALAMQQGIRLQALGQLGYVSLTFAEVVQRVTDRWWQQRHRRDRNEQWFYNRRQRTR
ncbi:FAD-dependent oxidoreductase [Altericista sp. CCNU0014]|uniref:FAD-dependent oxidoreductase n=1 Tax=Altericista sp. CCNU0014 TaxID=3082949 RepID=UPI00384CFD94